MKDKAFGKTKTFRATRKIRKFDDDFDPRTFGTEVAVDIYVRAHKALSE